jgi:hypothetical protein
MTNRKHTAADSLGGKHTRSSKTRTYTHCVVVMWDYDRAMGDLHSAHADALSVDRRNFEYMTAIATGNDPHPCRDYSKPGVITIDEVAQAERVAEYKARIAGGFDVYREGQLARRLSQLASRKAAGYFDTFGSVGWCGRHDLALKLAAQYPSAKAVEILKAEVAA